MRADPESDLLSCRQLMKGGSKSFFAASLMLPQRVRGPATALYAFCRLADDAIDLGGDAHAAMQELRARLDGIYAGVPFPVDADRALAAVVHRHAIPRALLDALLDGFFWDAIGRRYDTLAEVHDYAARVAGAVGAMMALVMGERSPQALARACELGIAMQLTNIARDVGEDARNGRLYLPRQWLAEEGLDADAWLKRPEFGPAIARVVGRLLADADTLYARSEHGIAALPRDCRPAIRAARLVYAEIGHRLRRQGLDSISSRTVVPTSRKLALMAQAAAATVSTPGSASTFLPPLPAVQYLIDAVPAPETARRLATVNRSFEQRVAWLLELLERQAAQSRAQR